MAVIYGPLLNTERAKKQLAHWHTSAYEEMEGDDLPNQSCVVCGQQMTYPGIVWMAYHGMLYFHPACVMHWMIRLLRDVHESECVTGRSTTRHPFEVSSAQG